MMSHCALLDTFLPATFAWTLLLATTFLYVWYPYRLLYLSQCPWILAPQAVVLVHVLVNFSLTTFSDPGIIPHPSADEERSYGYLPPAYQEQTINGIVVRLKWCTTCKFYRPPRCSHCSVCNRCIELFDHHCPWVNNCIGRRNYRHFFCFLVSLSVHTVAMLTLSLNYALLRLDRDRLAEPEPTVTVALIVVAALLAPSIVCLTCSHVLLILYGRTTNEQVTGKFKGGHNPFRRRHCCSDGCYKLCGPQFPSFLG